MSQQHPIVAVTGSAGAGTTTVRHAFSDIFRRQGISAQFVKGDSFYRYGLAEMEQRVTESSQRGRPISYFGPEANHFDKLENLFQQYAKSGGGEWRCYVRDDADAKRLGLAVGGFTPWRKVDKGTDLLFYEGMHGGVAAHTWTRRKANPAHLPQGKERRGSGGKGINAAQHVDLLIGVVPAVNLEWIQNPPRLQPRRLLGGRNHHHYPASHARLHLLHCAAIRAHRYQFSAYAPGGHLPPLYRTRHSNGRREHRRYPLPRPA